MRTAFILMALAVVPTVFAACSGEDRSGEQPFPPVVVTCGADVIGGVCIMHGEVTASPNSSLLECGFEFGNDTLREKYKAENPDYAFSATVDNVAAGRYYIIAYATNGMGESWGDTVRFDVP